jgi:hypothetical protein
VCAAGLAACSPRVVAPSASLSGTPDVSDAAEYAASDETSPQELARIYPLASGRPSPAVRPVIAQTIPIKKGAQASEPETTGAVEATSDPLVDPQNQPGRLAMEQQFRAWDAAAQRATRRVCTAC